MQEDTCQEARGAETRTSVTVLSRCGVLEKAGHPVGEVHHAGNHDHGRLLYGLRTVRVVRSWQLLAPDSPDQMVPSALFTGFRTRSV